MTTTLDLPVQLGEPRTHGGLTLTPLFPAAQPGLRLRVAGRGAGPRARDQRGGRAETWASSRCEIRSTAVFGIAVSAREGTLSCAALHLPAAMPEVVDAAFAVSDELDRVPYTYALRTVVGHGDSLVLLSKVAVLPQQRMPFYLGTLLYTTLEPLVAAHRALHAQKVSR